MRVLVCGGRGYSDSQFVSEILDGLSQELAPITAIIQGGARGADSHAAAWADKNNCLSLTFHADWTKHGRSAGPIRNRRMIDEGRPDLVVAFPGGRGTADMISQAGVAHLDVILVPGSFQRTARVTAPRDLVTESLS